MFGHDATAALETATKFMAEMQEIVSLDEDDLANVNHCMSYVQLEARSDEDETPQEVKRIFGAGYDIIRVCEKNCVGDARHCVVERRRSCQHQPMHVLFTVGGTVR